MNISAYLMTIVAGLLVAFVDTYYEGPLFVYPVVAVVVVVAGMAYTFRAVKGLR